VNKQPAAEKQHIVEAAPRSWRDILQVHPAAERFPLMNPDELRELGEDIGRRGMRNPIVIWSADEDDKREFLLDGRNRLDAAAMAGLLVVDDDSGNLWLRTGDGLREIRRARVGHGNLYDTDPYRLALSYNIHRRHLTAEQRRDLVAKLLKATPEISDRQIAETVKVDHKTVAKVRAEKVSTGEIPQLKKTKGKDGKSRPTHKKRATEKAADALIDPAPAPKVGAKRSRILSDDCCLDLVQSWSEVVAQIASGNRTKLKEAFAQHLRTVTMACAELEAAVS
jgi:hypothetical protein